MFSIVGFSSKSRKDRGALRGISFQGCSITESMHRNSMEFSSILVLQKTTRGLKSFASGSMRPRTGNDPQALLIKRHSRPALAAAPYLFGYISSLFIRAVYQLTRQ